MKTTNDYTDILNELAFLRKEISVYNEGSDDKRAISPIDIVKFARKGVDCCFKNDYDISKVVYRCMFLFGKKEMLIVCRGFNEVLNDEKVTDSAVKFIQKTKSKIRIIICGDKGRKNSAERTHFFTELVKQERIIKKKFMYKLLSMIGISPKNKVSIELPRITSEKLKNLKSFTICDNTMYREKIDLHKPGVTQEDAWINFNDVEECNKLVNNLNDLQSKQTE